ncbi:MAG: DUF3382 domain-containing protein, partial [Proteobacteria bacterium]|nr:DUF3382 domain-containing protein [Pseudomonadota bacterium]
MSMTSSTTPTGGSSAALKDAAFAALVTAGLCFPIIALRSDQDMSNRLVLETRWSWVLIAAAVVFVGRLVMIALQGRMAARAAVRVRKPAKAATAASDLFAKAISISGLVFLFVFPFLVLFIYGPGGALKWINNYGVQI